MKPLLRLIPYSAILMILFVGCGPGKPPPVAFAPNGYDFARLEHEMPLAPADLVTITPENLKAASQEQVDQIYARLTAGPIPDGSFDGQMFFPKGSSGKARLAEIVGGGLKGRLVNFKSAKIEKMGGMLWKGKVFYRDQRVLRNRIEDLVVLKLLLGDDADRIEKIEADGKDQWLLFPAKLYCGQSLLDGRRESVLIDYAFTDDLDGYREMPDALVGRDGLEVRDEIRMIRPGFYLGRAYMKKAFVLNFMLTNKAVIKKETAAFKTSGQVNEDCWIGSQRLTAMAR